MIESGSPPSPIASVRLEEAKRESRLPEAPSARPALNDLLVRLRLVSSSG